MKDLLKYSLIGLTISPFIILFIVYLVSFLFVLRNTKNQSLRDDFIHAYEISYMAITLILAGFTKQTGQQDDNILYHDNYL